MKKLLPVVVALVVLAVCATAPAKSPGAGPKNAAKHCKALRAEMGADAFRATFGAKRGKSAFGRCVSIQRKARKAARKRARRACRTEGARGRALKRCVRTKLAEAPAPAPADYEAALEQCRAEQAEDPEGFEEEFGSGPPAISKCIADEIASDSDEDEPEADEPAEDEEEIVEEPGDEEELPGDEPPADEL